MLVANNELTVLCWFQKA